MYILCQLAYHVLQREKASQLNKVSVNNPIIPVAHETKTVKNDNTALNVIFIPTVVPLDIM